MSKLLQIFVKLQIFA